MSAKMNMEDKSKNIRILFSILAGRSAHIVTIIIVGHLLIEHLLDKIITAKLKNKKDDLKKVFSQKLEFLYPSWLPLFIYQNTKSLNKSRNNIVHNLGAIKYEPIIYLPHGNRRILKIPKRKNGEKFYFRELINTILFDLVNYSHSLNIPNEPDLNIIFRLKK